MLILRRLQVKKYSLGGTHDKQNINYSLSNIDFTGAWRSQNKKYEKEAAVSLYFYNRNGGAAGFTVESVRSEGRAAAGGIPASGIDMFCFVVL